MACCRDESGRELAAENSGGRRGGRQQQQCGLCALVARVFRRAVCGAPSRRGSGDSYQELTAPPPEDERAPQVSFICILCVINYYYCTYITK